MFLSVSLRGFILLVSILIPIEASSLGGLKFHGSELPIDKRTSYKVFGDESPEFSGAFDVAFNLSLYPTTEFGYIVRIKNSKSNRIYNLFYDGQGDNLIFKFNEEGTHSLIVATLRKEALLNMHWFNVKIAFDLMGDSISLTIHDQVFKAANKGLPDTYNPVVVFGRSDHVIDVPSFAIKNLSIGGTERFFFPLDEIEGDRVHDASGDAIGKVSNPEWLMNDAYHWRHKKSFRSTSVAGANYSAEKNEVYYFNRDSLQIYNVRTGDAITRTFEERCPVDLVLGTNFLDARYDKLYAYEVYYETPGDKHPTPTVASLDLDNYRWTAESFDKLPGQLHHHGSFLDTANNEYTVFGGFGNMRYSKSFFTFDLETKAWSEMNGLTGDFLSPRYFSSMGYSEKTNCLYVFGGMGNESGEQIVGRKYYYDLYRIDLNTKKISKLWEIEWKQDNMVPVRGMVLLDDSTFYTLCYPEHFSESYLRLYRFSLKNGEHQVLGDSIPIRSDKITTNANLYYDGGLNNLYVVVQEFEDDISSDLKIYSLAFPPVTAQELASYSRGNKDNTLLVVLLSVSILGGVGYVIFRRLRSKAIADQEAVRSVIAADDITPAITRPNAVYLFGDFTARSKNNRDITYMFSEQLKQILCLVLQYSTIEEGIASPRLSNILWPDKPADKVKNSRGVTINHLRRALSEMNGIELVYEKGYFKLVQSGEFYCDYTRCMQMIARNEVDDHRDEFLELVLRGKFLQLSDHPVFDAFKEEVEKKLEPVLRVEMEKAFEAEQYADAISFAQAIFNIDPLHEVALTYQIRAMQRLKMADEARIRYQAFAIEYKKVIGSEYPHPFKSLT